MEDTSGKRHALRVLLSEPSSNLEKICRISQRGTLPIPPTLWLEDGVRSGDEWWPALLMPWCEGTPLDLWVERQRNAPERLRELAATLLDRVCCLAEAGLVHGDLQHGNVLVGDADELLFVDLDGLVQLDAGSSAPAHGWTAPAESGHPNYQHPERTSSSVWSPSVDVFSTLVIDTAVRAVALEPKLLDKYYTEDNLLMVAADLDDPVTSEVFDRLRALGDEAVSVRCQQLTAFCRQTINGVRPVRSILLDGEAPVGHPYDRPWYSGLPTHAVVSDWDLTELDLIEAPTPPSSTAGRTRPSRTSTTAAPVRPGTTSATGPSSDSASADWRFRIALVVLALVLTAVVVTGLVAAW
jgi:serine/threonine protein kinase